MLKSIKKEIKMRKSYLNGAKISSIYFGGGPPSILNKGEIKSLINTIYSNFKIDTDAFYADGQIVHFQNTLGFRIGVEVEYVFPINKNKLWFFMLLGGVGGLVRISTEMLLALVLGMPDAFFLIYLPYIISQILFGIASGFITKSIINTTEE